MKRYSPDLICGGEAWGDAPTMTEDADGEWVKYEDVIELVNLVRSLAENPATDVLLGNGDVAASAAWDRLKEAAQLQSRRG